MPRKVWETPPSRRRGSRSKANTYRYPRPERVGGFLTRKRADRQPRPGKQPDPVVIPVQPQRVVDMTELTPTVRLPELYQRADAIAPRIADLPKETLGDRLAPLGRSLWRHRWQIAPFLVTVLMATGATLSPVATGMWLLALGVGAHLTAQHGPDRIAGRAWLSRRERTLLSYWAVGGCAWSLLVALGWWPSIGIGWLPMACLTGAPIGLYLHGRRTRGDDAEDENGLSPQAKALIAAWPYTIGLTGPDPLKGSRIVASTMTEPAEGAYAFSVELGHGIHGEQATGEDLRRYLERALHLPVKTVSLAVDRDDSARIKVTMTPSRHLEGKPVAWPGPILHADGTIDLADAPDGSVVRPALHNEDGVEHFAVFGASGAGKSYTVVAMLLPGVMARREVVIYLDGGEGSSAGHIAGACDWYVTKPADFGTAIRVVHKVMRARKARRARVGLSRWCGIEETDPIITLMVDESTTVLGYLSRAEAALFLEVLREGRKLGVRAAQSTQDPMGDGLIGGRVARGLMGGAGSLIGHRPGDSTANTLTGSSSSAQIDLRSLPPEPGWCAIFRRGAVLSKSCRVRKPTDQHVRSLLDGFEPRALDGDDLDTAGDEYQGRTRGVDAARRMADEAAGRPVAVVEPDAVPDDDLGSAAESAAVSGDGSTHPDFDRVLNSHAQLMRAQGETNRAAVLTTLRASDGMTFAEIRKATGLSQSTVKRAVRSLTESGEAARGESGWIAVEPNNNRGDTAA
jgi:hypothetical protein